MNKNMRLILSAILIGISALLILPFLPNQGIGLSLIPLYIVNLLCFFVIWLNFHNLPKVQAGKLAIQTAITNFVMQIQHCQGHNHSIFKKCAWCQRSKDREIK